MFLSRQVYMTKGYNDEMMIFYEHVDYYINRVWILFLWVVYTT